jgi:hypothetical protein
MGTVQCKVGSHVLTIPNARYIPDLSESIYCLFQHFKTPNHGFDSTYDDVLYLRFPTFKTKAMIGSDDIYLDTILYLLLLMIFLILTRPYTTIYLIFVGLLLIQIAKLLMKTLKEYFKGFTPLL